MKTVKRTKLDQIINCDVYPLNNPQSITWELAVKRVRTDLQVDGCCVLDDFIRSEVIADLEQQSEMLAPYAYYEAETVNVYNTNPDLVMDANHPAKITFQRGNAFVARDLIPQDQIIHILYTDNYFKKFISACFDLDLVYELSDPLAGLCVNVLKPGCMHPWHFDTNEFTVSLLTKSPVSGGIFQYCPNIRSPKQENFSDVYAVITGNADQQIQSLPPKLGSLQLFKGRYSLHRVSSVLGNAERHSAIFAYSQSPAVIGKVERTKQLFGRVLPVHYAAEHECLRSDKLMD